jgi:hypothetical protein
LEIFGALLERAGLQTVSLGSENQLRSYVARCIRRKK